MSMIISFLTGDLMPYIAGAFTLIVGFLGLRYKFIRQGRNVEKKKQAVATKRSFDAREEVEDAIAGRTDDDRRSALGRWSRK